MIRLSFKITWPLLFLLAFALITWLLRQSRQSQTRAALDPARVVFAPPDSPSDGEDTFDRFTRQAAEAGRQAYTQPTEFTGAADRLRSRRYAHPNR